MSAEELKAQIADYERQLREVRADRGLCDLGQHKAVGRLLGKKNKLKRQLKRLLEAKP